MGASCVKSQAAWAWGLTTKVIKKKKELTWILPEGGGRPVDTSGAQGQFLGSGRARGHQITVSREIQISATGGACSYKFV